MSKPLERREFLKVIGQGAALIGSSIAVIQLPKHILTPTSQEVKVFTDKKNQDIFEKYDVLNRLSLPVPKEGMHPSFQNWILDNPVVANAIELKVDSNFAFVRIYGSTIKGG